MDDHLPTIEEQIAANNDSETLGEMMNKGMSLNPGFTVDRPGLIQHIEEDIDDTVARSKHAHDAQPDDAT